MKRNPLLDSETHPWMSCLHLTQTILRVSCWGFTCVAALLKITGAITLAWFWVVAPVLAYWAFLAVAVIGIFVWAALETRRIKKLEESMTPEQRQARRIANLCHQMAQKLQQ